MIISLNHTVWKYEIKESYHWNPLNQFPLPVYLLPILSYSHLCAIFLFIVPLQGHFWKNILIKPFIEAMPSWSREFNLQAQMVQLDETVLLPTKDGFENNIYATESPSASRTPWTIASKKYRHKNQQLSEIFTKTALWLVLDSEITINCAEMHPTYSKFIQNLLLFGNTSMDTVTTCASRPSLSGHWILASASCNKFSTTVGPRIQL